MWHCNDLLGSSRIPFDAKTSLHTAQGSLTANVYTNQIVDVMYCFLMPIKGLLFSKMVLTFTLSEQPYALAFEKPRSQYELNHHLIVYSYSFIVRNISVLPTASMCVALCIHLCMNHSLSDLAKSCKVKMRGVTLV